LHDHEYFDTVTAFDSSSSDVPKAAYPDSAALRAFAESACSLAFHSDKVPADKRESLSYQALIPSKQAWETQDEDSNSLTRRVYCMLSDRAGDPLQDGMSWTQVR
jgi:hypothetical protein